MASSKRINTRTTTKIGTRTPAEDYAYLCKAKLEQDEAKDDDIEEQFELLSAQMRNVIDELLFKSTRDETEKVAKALDIYKDKACFYNPYDYNDWIKEVKEKLVAKKKKDFWENVIVKNNLGLCCALDCDFFDDMDDKEPEEFYKWPEVTSDAEESDENDSDDKE